MKVFKFGGASVKDAESVINLSNIVSKESGSLLIVVSAMGKMTNAFEKMLRTHYHDKLDYTPFLNDIKRFHLDIASKLFTDKEHAVYAVIHEGIDRINSTIIEGKRSQATYDFIYDQVVSFGEYLSTKIVSAYLNEKDIENTWMDAQSLIITDIKYRNASIDWEQTEEKSKNAWAERSHSRFVTQGFIGRNKDGYTTTLGREGSDFTAAVFANVLEAEEVVIWKDVPGILNADPKHFNNPKKLSHISYHEAIELAYYGATVIHPKTIKPLENKGIPLKVKSFIDPEGEGSLIDENINEDSLIPSYIFRQQQALLSISPRDYSFIMEENLSHIFGVFANHGLKINLMQNSAISFSVCMDYDEKLLQTVIEELQNTYKVLYNTDLELLTVRHYDQKTIDFLTENKEILVTQKSRHTARLVMRNLI